MNWQEIIALGIVMIAAFNVLRRLQHQFLGFLKTTPEAKLVQESSSCSGCEGCSTTKQKPQLVSIALSAPVRPKIPNIPHHAKSD